MLSQDEARVPRGPTLATTLGVRGQRPHVVTRDNKDIAYAFGSADLTRGRLVADVLATRAKEKRRTRESKTRTLQRAFVRHLGHVARAYPRRRYRQVTVLIDNAPWHAGQPVRDVLAKNPHLALKRLPSYSPALNPIERLWKVLRRMCTHNRPFDDVEQLARALRACLRYLARRAPRLRRLLSAAPSRGKT